MEGDLKEDLEEDLEGELEVDLEGEMEGDSKGDFKQDMEGDLLSSSGQVRSRSGLIQVIQLKFNSLELDSEVERRKSLSTVGETPSRGTARPPTRQTWTEGLHNSWDHPQNIQEFNYQFKN